MTVGINFISSAHTNRMTAQGSGVCAIAHVWGQGSLDSKARALNSFDAPADGEAVSEIGSIGSIPSISAEPG